MTRKEKSAKQNMYLKIFTFGGRLHDIKTTSLLKLPICDI